MSGSFGYSPVVQTSAAERSAFAAAAAELAELAGQATLPFFRANTAVENKRTDGGFDPVTEADRAAEQVIRQELAQRFPEHGIYGEEFGYQAGNGLTWVIDPIDGTRAFMSGQLHWGVLLALFDGQRPVAGAFCQPFVGELLWGDGTSAFYRLKDGEPSQLKTSTVSAVRESILGTTGTDYFESDEHRACFARLADRAKLTRIGGDCYLFVLVALGQIEIAIDGGLNPYDIQALIPIVQGAGGVVTRLDGDDPAMGGMVLAASNQALVDAVQGIWKG